MNEISSIIKKIRKEKVKDERKEKKKFYSDCQERLILNFEEVIGYYARNIEDIHSLNRRMFNKVNLELNNKISETVNLGSESLNETISHELGKSFRGLLQEITVFFTNTVIIGGINEAKIQPHSRYRDYVSETPNVRDFYNGNFSKRK